MSKANKNTDKAIRYLKILMDACNNSTVIHNSVLDKINEFLKEDTIDIEFIFDDVPDAKIALLEAQVIAKDMEILVLKEKLDLAYKNTFKACVELTDEQVKNMELNKLVTAMEKADLYVQILIDGLEEDIKLLEKENIELECDKKDLLGKNKEINILHLQKTRQLAKIPNWIKNIATWWAK